MRNAATDTKYCLRADMAWRDLDQRGDETVQADSGVKHVSS